LRAEKGILAEMLERCRSGVGDVAALTLLTRLEAAFGEPLTFITWLEWRRMEWASALPLSEARADNVLFGAWLSWYSQFWFLAFGLERATGRPPAVRRLDGSPVGDALIEELDPPLFCSSSGSQKVPRKLIASYAPLVHPFDAQFGGRFVVCVSCALHDVTGEKIWAAALGWNAYITGVNATWSALQKWARDRGTPAEEYEVWEDLDFFKAFPLLPDPELVIEIPVVDKLFSKKRKRPARQSVVRQNVVVPFPPRREGGGDP